MKHRTVASKRRGFVTAIESHRACVRWTGRSKGEWVGKRSVGITAAPRVLMLEGSLDPELHSTRSERAALETWCTSNGIELAFKNIHSLEDLVLIAQAIGKERPPFIHLSCHGKIDGRTELPYLLFAPRERRETKLFLGDDRTIAAFRSLAGHDLLLSACLVGRYGSEIQEFRKQTGLRRVAAFTREICDHEAILFDLALYQASINLGLTFSAAIERARQAVGTLGVKGHAAQHLVRVL